MSDEKEGNQRWRTPDWLFKACEDLIGERFKLDAAAEPVNAKCRKFYTVETNGLLSPWVDATYCNPGFKIFGAWMKHAVEECERLKMRAALVGPKGCSQTWFHRYAKRGTIYAPDHRIAFDHYDTGEPTNAAREDVMVYLLGPGFWNKGKHFDVRALDVAAARAKHRK